VDRILPPSFRDLGPSDPRVIGDYALLGRLGTGGMGTAYLAEKAGKLIVVKVLRPDLAENPDFRIRLRRELESLRRLAHLRSTKVVGDDLACEAPWFAVEYVEGMTLADRVATVGPLRGRALEALATDLAHQIESIHSVGVTHRDIKPSNIILTPPRGTASSVQIIDFGVALIDEHTAMTTTGVMVGTLGWASPEQVSGDPVGRPADIHAWALCVLYAATGRTPFDADSAASVVYKVMHSQPQIPEDIPPGLVRQITAALHKDQAKRPTIEWLTQGKSELEATIDATQVDNTRIPPLAGAAAANVELTPHDSMVHKGAKPRPTGKAAIAVSLLALVSLTLGGLAILLLGGSDAFDASETTDVSSAAALPSKASASEGVTQIAPTTSAPAPQSPTKSAPLINSGDIREEIPIADGCSVEVSGNGGFLVITSELDSTVTVLDLNSNRINQTTQVGSSPCTMVAIKGQGEGGTVVYVNGAVGPDGVGTGWSTLSLESANSFTLQTESSNAYEYVLASAGGTLLTSDDPYSLLSQGRNPPSLLRLDSPFTDAQLSRDGTTVFVSSGTSPGLLSIYDTANASLLNTIPLSGTATSILLSPDESTIFATGITDGEVTVIDVAGRRIADSIQVGSGGSALALSPAGDILYVGDLYESRIRFIDVATGEVLGQIDLASLIDFALDRDGQTLYALGEESLAVVDLVWNSET